MAQSAATEQTQKRKRSSGLQSTAKRARMAGVEDVALRPAVVGKTARERALNLEKERKQRQADEQERTRAKDNRRKEKAAKMERAENEREEVEKMEDWIEKISDCPVYRPTKEQFADPLKYIGSLADEVAPKFGICKIIPPYVNGALTGRELFSKPDFRMEVRKQPLRMVDWSEKGKQEKDINFNKDTKMWTFKDLEAFANDFVEKNYQGSSSQLQYRFIEREFWKEFLLRRNKAVRYASDVPGTAFDKEEFEELSRSKWNLGKLPTLEESVLRNVEVEIPGVTKPMLYVGMLFSMFAWHVEDQYLYSINYHHLGAPKTWYGVPGCAAQELERVARTKVFNLPDDSEGMARTLRLLIGKTIMFPPKHLVEEGVPVCRAVQQPGEFVVTYPRSYHAGYSNGFNCGEAVNFAMAGWLPFGVACTRRYRLLRQIQVVAYDELLCKDAQDLHQRMKESQCQLTAMDECVMVEFVRLLRWQYRERWKLHLEGAEPVSFSRLGGGSIECALCNHKNYLAYVLCDCPDMMAPVCLNHPAELRRCHCKPSPDRQDPDQLPGRQVMYLQDLPLLEAIASDFESQPGILDKLTAAAEGELESPELQDQWQLCGRQEQPMGRAEQLALTHMAEPSTSAYQLWAPIPGYNYETVLAVQPGTPSQQMGEAAEVSQGSRGKELLPPEQPLSGGAPMESQESCLAIQVRPEAPFWSSPKQAPILLPPETQPATPFQAAPALACPIPSEMPVLTLTGNGGGSENLAARLEAVEHQEVLMRTRSGNSESGVGQKEGEMGQGNWKAFEEVEDASVARISDLLPLGEAGRGETSAVLGDKAGLQRSREGESDWEKVDDNGGKRRRTRVVGTMDELLGGQRADLLRTDASAEATEGPSGVAQEAVRPAEEPTRGAEVLHEELGEERTTALHAGEGVVQTVEPEDTLPVLDGSSKSAAISIGVEKLTMAGAQVEPSSGSGLFVAEGVGFVGKGPGEQHQGGLEVQPSDVSTVGQGVKADAAMLDEPAAVVPLGVSAIRCPSQTNVVAEDHQNGGAVLSQITSTVSSTLRALLSRQEEKTSDGALQENVEHESSQDGRGNDGAVPQQEDSNPHPAVADQENEERDEAGEEPVYSSGFDELMNVDGDPGKQGVEGMLGRGLAGEALEGLESEERSTRDGETTWRGGCGILSGVRPISGEVDLDGALGRARLLEPESSTAEPSADSQRLVDAVADSQRAPPDLARTVKLMRNQEQAASGAGSLLRGSRVVSQLGRDRDDCRPPKRQCRKKFVSGDGSVVRGAAAAAEMRSREWQSIQPAAAWQGRPEPSRQSFTQEREHTKLDLNEFPTSGHYLIL